MEKKMCSEKVKMEMKPKKGSEKKEIMLGKGGAKVKVEMKMKKGKK